MARNKPLLIEIGEGLSIMVGTPTINAWSSNNRPQNPKIGTFGFNLETNCLEYWDGKDWYCASMSQP